MFQLRVTVINALGTFSGVLQFEEGHADEATVSGALEELLGQVNILKSLSLIQNDGTTVSFPQPILQNSVFKFAVEDAE